MKMGDRKLVAEASQSPASPMPAATEPQGRSLMEVFWRGRWILLVSIVASLSAAFVYLKKATPLFAANSRLYIEQTGPKIIADSVGNAAGGPAGNYLTTQCELMRSAAILSLAADKPEIKNLKTFRGISNPIAAIRDAMEVTIGKNNDLVTISFLSPYPEDSAIVVNAIVDAYTTYHSNQKRSTAAEVLKILGKEKDTREAELQEKLKAMLEFRKNNSTISFESERSDHADLTAQRVNSLTEALTGAQIERIEAESRLSLVKEDISSPAKIRQLMATQNAQPGGSPGSPGQSPEESQLRAQLVAAELEVNDLQEGRGLLPNHPSVLAAKTKVEYLQAKIGQITGASEFNLALNSNGAADTSAVEQRFAQAYVTAAEQRVKLAHLKEAELQKQFGTSVVTQQRAAVDSNNKIATYALMDADFKRIERLCDMLDSRMKEIHVTEDVGALNISILEVAKPALVASKPERARTLSMALMFGIALGCGLCFVNAWLDQRLRSADEIQAYLSLPLLGAIPHIIGKLPASVRGRKVDLEPSSDVAEAYRTVRTSLYFGVPDSKTKTLLITSPAPGDGKTTSASNLAIALAQAGQRTLIVDADFRKPTQHKIFQLKADTGFTSVLAGKATLSDAIQPTGIANLDLLPCGPVPSNPAEILNSQTFADYISELAQQYDHVLLDSPPVMPVTDARILGAMADVTILVLRAEKSTRRAGEHARDVLLSVGTNILGVVVNGVRRGRGRYGYYYGYYQYGYYGERKSEVLPVGDGPPPGDGASHDQQVTIVRR